MSATSSTLAASYPAAASLNYRHNTEFAAPNTAEVNVRLT